MECPESFSAFQESSCIYMWGLFVIKRKFGSDINKLGKMPKIYEEVRNEEEKHFVLYLSCCFGLGIL